MLSMFVNDRRDNWNELLPYVMHAYRTSVQSIMSSYESVLDQMKPCRLTHVPKNFNGQRLQCYYEYWRILSSHLGGFLKLSSIIRQSSRRTIMCGQRIHQSQMREQLQCHGRIVPSVWKHDGIEHLPVLFPASHTRKPRHFSWRKCYMSGGSPASEDIGTRPSCHSNPAAGYCIYQHVLRGPGKILTIWNNILDPSFSKNVRS